MRGERYLGEIILLAGHAGDISACRFVLDGSANTVDVFGLIVVRSANQRTQTPQLLSSPNVQVAAPFFLPPIPYLFRSPQRDRVRGVLPAA